MPVCLIGLGSNQGNRQATLGAAVTELRNHPQITVLNVSAWHETAPVGGPSGQSRFLNGALTVNTSLDPHQLLACLQDIENRLGRVRTTRWAERTIDLDLLLYDTLTLDTPSLTLPHPRMAWRRFVLEPAAEVAATMLHPTTQWTLARLLEHLNTAPRYVAITGPIAAGKTHLAERLAAAIPARLILEQPDWSHLDAFYADPPGHAWQIEIEFLRQRASLLDANTEQSSSHWSVSDFWFDQSAAFARAWLSEEQLPKYLEEFERWRSGVIRPKLVVRLDAQADELLANIRRRGRTCERPLTREQLDRIRQTVREQTSEPDSGPVLHVGSDDREATFTEVLAAVQGME